MLQRLPSLFWFGLFLALLVYVSVVQIRGKDHWLKRLGRWLCHVIDLISGL